MLPKFSVRKPFTVLVAVILAITLGVVSITRTTTDLLPDMNLPYAVVFTVYPGASPEEVEQALTIPIEQRMGAVSNLSSIQSISQNNVSIVILEFNGDSDMDSISIEMRENLDMLTLPSDAGKPTMLKINPNILPVMVVAADMDGRSLSEVSRMVESSFAPALESVEGVASVTTSGMIRNELHVLISREKIDAVNLRIQDAINAQVEAAQADAEEQVRAQVAAAVQEYAQTRMPELLGSGLSPEAAQSQLDIETAAMAEQLTQEAMAEMQEQMENTGGESTQFEGLPEDMLTVDSVSGILQAQNFSMPAGYITDGDTEYLVRTGDKFSAADEISSLLIAEIPVEGLEPILLSDLADVFETDNSKTTYTRVNGNPAVMLTLQKQTEYSTSDVTHRVHEKMAELMEDEPDLHMSVLMDQGQYVDVVVDSVVNNLLFGALLAVLVLLVFLRDIKPTFIIAVSIPISLLVAFALMYFSGVSMNIISMSGLALGVGMLVDNSIVVIENIYRMRSLGVPARKAAIEGAKQMSGPIAASTLTTMAVFAPIVFTTGLARQLFTDMALTICYSLLASLIVALSVVPAMAQGMLRKSADKEHKLFGKVTSAYTKALAFTLRHKVIVLIVVVALLAFSLWGVLGSGTELIPAMDSPQITVSVTMPEGSVFDESVEMAEEITARISALPDVKSVGATIGGGAITSMLGLGDGGVGGGGTSISMYLIFEDERELTNAQLSQRIREMTDDLGAEVSVSGSTADMSMFAGDGISVSVRGRDNDTLAQVANEVADIIREVPGAAEVTSGSGSLQPELRITVDKDEAMKHGLTVAQVLQAVAGRISEPKAEFDLVLDEHDYTAVVTGSEWVAPAARDIESLELTGSSGDIVTLTDIASVSYEEAKRNISRMDQQRYVTVTGQIAEGHNVGLVNSEIERRLEGYDAPFGYTLAVEGENLMIRETFEELFLMLALGILFIYLIMVAQFQSLLSPFIVMFTLPLAFTGAFLALMIAGMPLSVVAMVGLILLMGIVVNNGIVLIDYINVLRRGGMDKTEAMLEAGRTRLRPIIMTALTTIVAMSTMSVGMGMGTEMVQPMAVTVIGGLIYATFMTLFIVPVIYDIFHRKNKKLKNPDAEEDEADALPK